MPTYGGESMLGSIDDAVSGNQTNAVDRGYLDRGSSASSPRKVYTSIAVDNAVPGAIEYSTEDIEKLFDWSGDRAHKCSDGFWVEEDMFSLRGSGVWSSDETKV